MTTVGRDQVTLGSYRDSADLRIGRSLEYPHRELDLYRENKRRQVGGDEQEDLENIDEDFSDTFAGLQKSAIDLLVNVGIISSIRTRWPADAQQNWVRELQNMTERIDDDIRTAQEFASAFD